jgi:hypothetical protein
MIFRIIFPLVFTGSGIEIGLTWLKWISSANPSAPRNGNAPCHRDNCIPESAQAFNNVFGPHNKRIFSERTPYQRNQQQASK